MPMTIDDVWNPEGRVLIVAEIGKNFITTEGEQPVETYLENAKALVKAAKEAGADDFIEKPFQIKDLLGVVERWI